MRAFHDEDNMFLEHNCRYGARSTRASIWILLGLATLTWAGIWVVGVGIERLFAG